MHPERAEAKRRRDQGAGPAREGELMAAEVRLVDLAVIKRYSLAVRQERAPAEEVLEALEDSAAVVIAALEGDSAAAAEEPEE